MVDRVVTIKLRIDPSGAVSGLDTYEGKLGQSVARTKSMFGGLSQQIQGALGGAIVGFGISGILSLRELGDAASDTRSIFEGLAGAGEEGMARLRTATRGAVRDVDLMRGAVRITSLHMAEDVGSSAEIMGRAVSLGLLNGVSDSSTALENYVSAMNLQTSRSLGQFGINIKDFQSRVDELKSHGVDAADAWRQVFETMGDELINKSGPALEQQVGGWDRLTIKIDNAKTAVGEFIANSLDLGAGLVEQLVTIAELIGRNAAAGSIPGMVPTVRTGVALGSLRGIDPMQAQGYTALAQWIGMLQNEDIPLDAIDPEKLAHLASNWSGVAVSTEEAAWAIRHYETAWDDFVKSQQRTALLMQGAPAPDGTPAALTPGAEMLGGIGQQYSDLMRLRFGSEGGIPTYFTQADADHAAALAGAMEEALLAYQGFKDQGELITDGEIAQAEELATQGRAWAVAVQAGADALQNMTLPQLFGTDDASPLLTGGTDAAVQAMKDAGVDQGLIDAYLGIMDLSSGRATELSNDFHQNVLPGIIQITSQFGAEAGAAASLAYFTGMQSAKGAGQTPAVPFMQSGWARFGGGSGGGRNVNVQPGWGYSNVAAEMDMSLAEFYAQQGHPGGQGMPMLHPGAQTFGGGAGGVFNMAYAGQTFGEETFGPGGPGTSVSGPPDLSGLMAQTSTIEGSWSNIAASEEVFIKGIEGSSTVVDGVVQGHEKWAGHSKNIASDTGRIRDNIKEVAGIHQVQFNLTTTTKDIPAFFMDWLRRGLVIIGGENGGLLPGQKP